MWTIECKHCKKKSYINELDVVDKEKYNMDMVTTTVCAFCNSRIEIQVSISKSEGLIEFT